MQKSHKITALIVLSILSAVLCGCGGNNYKKGKFTEEQMSTIAYPQRYSLPDPTGGVVLSIGSETITADEIINRAPDDYKAMAQKFDFNTFKTKAAPLTEKIVQSKIGDIVIYNEAKKNAPADIDDLLENAVETETNKFIIDYDGDYSKAQKALEQMGMDWISFKDYQKKLILSQSYISQQIIENKPITHSQLLDYYNENKDMF